jgi:uncharacterized protein (TIGR02186 family)
MHLGVALVFAGFLALGLACFPDTAAAQALAQRRQQPPPQAQPQTEPPAPPQQPAPARPAALPEARETVQADVSSRSVSITSSFTGTEIIVFGAVDNSRQSSPESGFYDVVIVVEGTPTRLVARKKSNVGIWLNTASITFQSVPSYYAIISTRPLDEIADPIILRDNDIGFEHVRMTPISGWETGVTTGELEDFKSAVVRIKQRERLYVERTVGGVVFIGRSLFRASLDLPANVPVGPLVARVHLFREGRLLHTFTSRVMLRREGLEHFLHTVAFGQPLIYGLATVLISIAMGLAATALFRRSAH